MMGQRCDKFIAAGRSPTPNESAGRPRPEHMEELAVPFVNIRIVKEVIADDPVGKKASIAADVTAAIQKTTGLAETDVWVVFEEVPAAEWYVGKTSVEERRRS